MSQPGGELGKRLVPVLAGYLFWPVSLRLRFEKMDRASGGRKDF